MAETTGVQLPLPQPEPGLSAEQVVARAAALRPMLQQQQEENDQRGHYSDALHEQFLRSGFYRILQPRLFGGYEMDFATYARVAMQIAQGHPASGWCFTLAASHGLVLGAHWPVRAQRELFGPDGEFRAAMIAGPAGSMSRTDGGYRVSGVWPFASGIPVATHFIGASLLPREGGAPEPVNFVVPREQITILPDWGGERSMGMRGSGSNSVRLTDVFVPDHYIVPSNTLLSSEHLPEGSQGTRLHGNPMYLGVWLGWFSCEFGAILTGTARAALDAFEQLLKTKKITFNPQLLRMHDTHAQVTFGEAMIRADAAEALTFAAIRLYTEQVERWGRDRTPISAADTLRVWAMAREACRSACEAVEMLFRAAGASVCKPDQPLQRYFRDVQMYRIHIQSQPTFPTLRAILRLGLPLPAQFGR